MPHAAERAKELSEGLLRRCSSVNRRRVAKSHFDRIRKPRDQLLDNERVGIAKKSARPIVVGSSRSGIRRAACRAPSSSTVRRTAARVEATAPKYAPSIWRKCFCSGIASFGNALFGEPERKRQRKIALLVLADDFRSGRVRRRRFDRISRATRVRNLPFPAAERP